MSVFTWWRARRDAKEAVRQEAHRQALEGLRAQFPGVDEFYLAGMLSPVPVIAFVSTKTVASIVRRQVKDARLRRIVREELAAARDRNVKEA